MVTEVAWHRAAPPRAAPCRYTFDAKGKATHDGAGVKLAKGAIKKVGKMEKKFSKDRARYSPGPLHPHSRILIFLDRVVEGPIAVPIALSVRALIQSGQSHSPGAGPCVPSPRALQAGYEKKLKADADFMSKLEAEIAQLQALL